MPRYESPNVCASFVLLQVTAVCSLAVPLTPPRSMPRVLPRSWRWKRC